MLTTVIHGTEGSRSEQRTVKLLISPVAVEVVCCRILELNRQAAFKRSSPSMWSLFLLHLDEPHTRYLLHASRTRFWYKIKARKMLDRGTIQSIALRRGADKLEIDCL